MQNKSIMEVPPPVLRTLFSENNKDGSSTNSKIKVWEISAPERNSLTWSILLAYMLLCVENDEDFSFLLESVKKNNYFYVSYEELKTYIKSFNPFKNRFDLFYNSAMDNVIHTFELIQSILASDIHDLDDLNDDMGEKKLYVASIFLNCQIEVLVLEGDIKRKIYRGNSQKNFGKKIILFQYKSKTHGQLKKKNIFRFGLNEKYGYNLQLDAFDYFLQKTNIPTDIQLQVKRLIQKTENFGKLFLYEIFRNDLGHISPVLYKEPYIAFNLAGFETNPTKLEPNNPSLFLFALKDPKSDTKLARMLYDYAANCRYFFNGTPWTLEENILYNLKAIHNAISEDIRHLPSFKVNDFNKERIYRTLKDLLDFNKYQQEIISRMKQFGSGEHRKTPKSIFLKNIIFSILDFYLDSYYHKTTEENIYENYLKFIEYYDNTDCFTGFLFFENLCAIKKTFEIYGCAQKLNQFSEIESNFFHLIWSNKIFPKLEHVVICKDHHDKAECEMSKNTLQLIPLFFREALKNNIEKLKENFNKQKNTKISQKKTPGVKLFAALCDYPEIRDELLINRLKYYLSAVLEVSVDDDKIKSCFAIERCLQVLGEYFATNSTEGYVVSCLLDFRIPQKIQIELERIRNYLFHMTHRCIQNRLDAESLNFRDLQEDLDKIKKSIEIVEFMQSRRIEEFLIKNTVVVENMKQSRLPEKIKIKFEEQSKQQLDMTITPDQDQYKSECIELSLDIIKQLKDCLNNKNEERAYQLLEVLKFIFNILIERMKVGLKKPSFENFTELEEILNKQCTLPDKINNLVCPALHEFESIICGWKTKDMITIMTSEDINQIMDAVKLACKEASESKETLIELVKKSSFKLSEFEQDYFKRLIGVSSKIEDLKVHFISQNREMSLMLLHESKISETKLIKNVKEFLNKMCIWPCIYFHPNYETKVLLVKLAYQENLKSKIYKYVNLDKSVCEALKFLLTFKLRFLQERISFIKRVLIDENDEIRETWNWIERNDYRQYLVETRSLTRSMENITDNTDELTEAKERRESKAVKEQMKFLMRQRILKEKPTKAALEMAFLDCLNILDDPEDEIMYKKMNNIFTVENLRNVLAHGTCVLEAVSGILNENDLTSELVNKMLILVEDGEAIEVMHSLLPYSNTLEQKDFESWIQENAEGIFKEKIFRVKRNHRWKTYINWMPLV